MNRLIVWGGTQGLESHRHIHHGFTAAAQKLGIHTTWVSDQPGSMEAIVPGSTVISADIYGSHLEPRPDVDYVLHNFDGSHPVCRVVEPEHLLRLQVWTTDASGEEWAPARVYNREGRILFQPWGTDLFAEEFLDPVYNPQSREASFVGAIWSDIKDAVDLGNYSMIQDLKLILADFGLHFVPYTHISTAENVRVVREARVAPAYAGKWQVDHGYLPCRLFKNISYGQLGISNVTQFRSILGDTWIGPGWGDVAETMRAALELKSTDYLDRVRAQQLKIAAYSYRESLEAIERALEAGR